MATVAALTLELRILVNDTTTANRIYQETPQGTVDGTNTFFRLQNPNIVPSSLFVTYDTTLRSQTNFTATDLPDGYITMTAPPALNKVFYADYAFNIFSDSDFAEFLANAARMITLGTSDATTVADGLVQVLLSYAAYFYWLRRAAQYAARYNAQGGGGVGEQVDVITTNFRNLAKQAKSDGDSMLNSFYTGQGQNKRSAAASIAFGIDPMTPLR